MSKPRCKLVKNLKKGDKVLVAGEFRSVVSRVPFNMYCQIMFEGDNSYTLFNKDDLLTIE